jgi:hypothetical protein
VSPDNFKAAFTAAEGWGSFTQKVVDGRLSASIELHYGTLHLKQWTLDANRGPQGGQAVVTLDDGEMDAQIHQDGDRTLIRFAQGVNMGAGQTLRLQPV